MSEQSVTEMIEEGHPKTRLDRAKQLARSAAELLRETRIKYPTPNQPVSPQPEGK